MKPKVGLSSVQRKMLDEIYTEQFEKMAAPILAKRSQEYHILKIEVIRKESAKEPLKSLLKTIKTAKELYEGVEDYMQRNGLKLDRSMYENRLEIDTYNGPLHPELAKHKEETSKIEQELARKRKEIRARIYGMETTYEEVEKEITKELATIKSI